MEKDTFRNYTEHSTEHGDDHVANFYRDNHQYQTLAFARQKAEQYSSLNRSRMSTWQAMAVLDELHDESDPDTDLSQLDHSLQTAQAIRLDNQPRWLQLTGLIHDLGKILCTYDEPQWAVVGDTYPLGCSFDSSIVYPDFFTANPDYHSSEYQSKLGIYKRHCGLNAVTMSWGHDEYLYQVMKPYLPEQALYVIRYHSFYSAHSAGAYGYLMNEYDQQMMEWVKVFQPYDLYSKADSEPDHSTLLHYYEDLVSEFLPDQLNW